MYIPNVNYDFEVGDTMTVLDIGYSKVDLTSHIILGLRPSRRMQQLSRVDHEFGYAGYHADENFKQFLRGKLKDEEGFSERTLGPAVVAFEDTLVTLAHKTRPPGQAKCTFSVASVESVPEEAFRIPVGGMADNVELRIQDG
ncbi:actin-like ATPase domain-containing protein [Apiospora arundinis]|uniref:Actin-like ATPase domain-containing protein n=1 Tax=Apiospora arundinis TaxID=335852 RepID=A0ABR2HKC0_9PEZI